MSPFPLSLHLRRSVVNIGAHHQQTRTQPFASRMRSLPVSALMIAVPGLALGPTPDDSSLVLNTVPAIAPSALLVSAQSTDVFFLLKAPLLDLTSAPTYPLRLILHLGSLVMTHSYLL